MKEYNENEAVEAMSAVLPEASRDTDSVCEVLDLIYDYYEENGELDIDDGEEETDVGAIVEYILKYFRKNAPEVNFTPAQLADMVRAEIEYESSLL